MDLDELLDRVDSKETFLRFLAALAADAASAAVEPDRTPEGWINLSPGGWESGTIAAYLEAMSTWAAAGSALTGEPMVPPQPSWRTFAEILYAGKIYE